MPTVYTMGDMPIFVDTLNAVASTFSSSMFDPAQGAGVFVIGILIGIVFMILPVTTGGKINPMHFIFALLLFFGGVVPKDRLQIEDIYTGQIAAVDNIPLILTIPASITATISKAIADQIETAYTTVGSSTYLSMGAEGFVNPLKLLLSFRDQPTVKRAFPFFSANLTEYVKFCAPTDPTFNAQTLSRSSDMVAYLTSLSVTGIMTYYSATYPNGIGIPCTTGLTYLQSESANIAAGTNINTLMKQATAGEFPSSSNASSAGATAAGLTNAYNTVTAGIVANSQNAQQFMINAIAMTSVAQGVDCVNQPSGPNMSTCMSEVVTRQAMEQTSAEAAGQASVFTKIAIPTMNILLALFYAFAPIVIAVAFVSGPHALKIMAGFLMFGAWTQSWMPIAAVLNYMVQMQTQYAFSNFPSTGMTMENYMQFYTILSTKISTASTMLAMTPIISFGLLSGSMMTLNSVASKFSSNSHVDPKTVAPDVVRNDSVVQNGSQLVRSPTMAVGQSGAHITGDTLVQGTTAGNQVFDKLGLQAATNKRLDSTRAILDSERKSASQDESRLTELGYSQQDIEQIKKTGKASLTNTKGSERAAIHSLAADLVQQGKLESDDRTSFENGMALQAKAGIDIFGSGASVAVGSALKGTTSASNVKSIVDSMKDSNSSTYKSFESAKQEWDKSKVHDVSNAKSIDEADKMAESLRVSTEKATSAENRIAELQSASRGLTSSKDMTSIEFASQLTKDGKSAQARSAINVAAQDSGVKDEAFNAAIKNKVDRMIKSGSKADSLEERNNLEVAAGLEILSSNDKGAENVINLLQQSGIVTSSEQPQFSEKQNAEYSKRHEAGTNAESIAKAGTSGAGTIAQEVREKVASRQEVLTPKDSKNIVESLNNKKMETEVSPDLAAPESRAVDAKTLADKTGTGDQTHVVVKAAVDTALTVATGGAGKLIGRGVAAAAPEAKAAIQAITKTTNPAMLGADAAAVRAENTAGKEALDTVLEKGGNNGAVLGMGSGGQLAHALHLNGPDSSEINSAADFPHGNSSGGAPTDIPENHPEPVSNQPDERNSILANGGVPATNTLADTTATPQQDTQNKVSIATPTKEAPKDTHNFKKTGFGAIKIPDNKK